MRIDRAGCQPDSSIFRRVTDILLEIMEIPPTPYKMNFFHFMQGLKVADPGFCSFFFPNFINIDLKVFIAFSSIIYKNNMSLVVVLFKIIIRLLVFFNQFFSQF